MKSSLHLAALVSVGCDGAFDLEHVEPPRHPPVDAGVEPGLVAHYPMETIVGSTVNDLAGGHDGVCVSNCPTPTTGRVGDGALEFSGATIVDVLPAPALQTTTAFTAMLWLRHASPLTEGCAFSKRFGPDVLNTYQVCVDADGVLNIYTYDDTIRYLPLQPIVADTWYHVAIVWNGMTIYGLLDGAVVISQASTPDFDDSGLIIGGDRDGPSEGFQWSGALDDIRLYDRALTDAEIRAISEL